jgi:hypothetical protein
VSEHEAPQRARAKRAAKAPVGRVLQRERSAARGGDAPAQARKQAPLTDRQGNRYAFEFRVGGGVSAVLARAAKELAGDAPLADAQIRRLQRVAKDHGGFSDVQRMFLAGLLDAENARTLSRTAITPGATFDFSLQSIRAGMPRLKQRGRAAMPARSSSAREGGAPPGRAADDARRGGGSPIAQNGNGAVARVPQRAPRLARQPKTIDVELIASRDEYRPPGGSEIYRLGDAAASRLLMDIQERGTQIVFRTFNFETGTAQEMSPSEWSFFRGAAIIGGSNAGITHLGQQLKPSEWRSLWPRPMPELLRRYEAGKLALDDQAVLTGYHGMIRTDASSALSANEKAIDDVLSAGDRVHRLEEYATGLREASMVRDTLIKRRDELSKSLVQQHAFTFGLPKAGTGADMAQRLNILREQAAIDDSLQFWISAFPLLTRLQTSEIESGSVETKLREIKANIVATREQLDRGRLDPMTLDTIRARVAGQLGPKATEVIAAEDKSRGRWALVGAAAMMAASIAILFLPGGLFIDAAIGVAIAGGAIAHAAEVGRAANTGLNVDDGLMSQSQASSARFGAVLATVFAVLGVAAAGFRVLRVGVALRGLNQSMPELSLAQRAATARAIADDPALVSVFARMAPGDAAVSSRVAAAVGQAGGDARALRAALKDVASFAKIPRRVPPGADLYEPLRQIKDGSDIERIAAQTGLPRAEVEAAKRNLMLEEHVLVDNQTGALYRGRFEPFAEVATPWSRAARGEALNQADREFLKRLVRHEHAEGTMLSAASGKTLEQAFFRGELDSKLKLFLQSLGWDQAKIARLLAVEPMPITPYRYAHLVSALSGAPNP